MDADRDVYPRALHAAWGWSGPLAMIHLIILLWRFGLAYLVRTPGAVGWKDGLERTLEPSPAWISWLMVADQWPGWRLFLWDAAILVGSAVYWALLLTVLEWWAYTSELRHQRALESAVTEGETHDRNAPDSPPTDGPTER
ncbi:MAG: hypothetical protein IT580_14550 [Verrucomicrobiales bacterium]|nr:hypothetical protein [Verrucomicrobiales bacterium]